MEGDVSASRNDVVLDDLRAYYEEEARQGIRSSLRGHRVSVRHQFIELLQAEDRRSVLDFGAGPGLDAPGFMERKINYAGIDLAHGNALLAAHAGVRVLHGSIEAPPVRAHSFDAGWSMSTLMHIPEPEVVRVLTGMASALRPGSPMLAGLWGAQAGQPPADYIDATDLPGHRRLFSLRSLPTNRDLLATIGSIESEETWDVGEDGWEYQVFRVRLD